MASILTMLYAARQGVSESDLQAALHLNQVTWSRMFFSLEDLLVERSGLLCVRRRQYVYVWSNVWP